MLRLRTTEHADLSLIAEDLRPMDRLECEAFGVDPFIALRSSWRRSVMSWTIEREGVAVGVVGVAASGLFGAIGNPWMLGTPALNAERRRFLTIGREKLAEIEAVFPRLQNWVHADNKASRRWLARLGFEFDPDVVHVGGHPMLRFHKGLPCASIPSQQPSP